MLRCYEREIGTSSITESMRLLSEQLLLQHSALGVVFLSCPPIIISVPTNLSRVWQRLFNMLIELWRSATMTTTVTGKVTGTVMTTLTTMTTIMTTHDVFHSSFKLKMPTNFLCKVFYKVDSLFFGSPIKPVLSINTVRTT